MTNELTVVSDADKELITTVLGGNLAQDIEFAQLDSAIEKIAAHTKALTPEERADASEFIDKFERRICNKLSDKKCKLHDLYEGMMPSATYSYYGVMEWFRQYEQAYDLLFARKEFAEYQDSWEEIKKGINAVRDYREEHTPEKPFIDEGTMTGLEIAKAKKEYEIKLAVVDIDIRKKQTEVRKKFYTFVTKLKKDKNHKNFCKVLKKQEEATAAASDIVEEKAQAAKMALLISDEEIRKALQEFHDFAVSLK